MKKTLTVRLPESLVAQIDAESRERRVTRSDVVRERLEAGIGLPYETPDALEDLIGAMDGLPRDLSARKKHYLKAKGYGRSRPR